MMLGADRAGVTMWYVYQPAVELQDDPERTTALLMSPFRTNAWVES